MTADAPPRPRPALTVALPTFGAAPAEGWRAAVELARMAEEAGVDRIVVSDHVVMGTHPEAYTWGRFPVPPDAPWLEPLTVLTAMAMVTSRVRLATGILISPLRPAALLAKTAATLDVLSGGRLDLGVGTGWQREEYDAEGLAFEDRGRLLTDGIAACRALWEHTPATFESESVSLQDIYCSPQPAQARLPVWFSGVLHARNLRRVVELGDGWLPIMGATVDEIGADVARLRGAFEEHGRAYDELRVQAPAVFARDGSGAPDLEATLASVPPLVVAGVTDVQVNLRVFCPDLADAPAVLDAMVESFAAAGR